MAGHALDVVPAHCTQALQCSTAVVECFPMTMLESDPLPLARDATGVIRIGGTRVSLESLVASYERGGSIQDLAEAFPDLSLHEIHSTIAYYLKHREEVEEYIAARRRAAEATEVRLREELPDAYR